MRLGELWSQTLGRKMSQRLMKWIVPQLVWNQEIYGLLVEKYTAGARWLDVGCGWRLLGNDLEPIENRMVASAAKVMGCDMDFPSLAKHRNIRQLAVGSAEALPFRDGSFDLVTCNMVVEHFRDPKRSFGEMMRVLSPGGRVIVHTPNLWNYAVFVNHTVLRRIPRRQVLKLVSWAEKRKEEDIFLTFYRANTTRRMKQIFGELGLEEESCRLLAPPRPVLNFFAPLALIQIVLIRMMLWRPFRRFGATIVAVFRRPPGGERPAESTA